MQAIAQVQSDPHILELFPDMPPASPPRFNADPATMRLVRGMIEDKAKALEGNVAGQVLRLAKVLVPWHSEAEGKLEAVRRRRNPAVREAAEKELREAEGKCRETAREIELTLKFAQELRRMLP